MPKEDDGEEIPALDLNDPQVQAEIARAKKAAGLAMHMAPPGGVKDFKWQQSREGYRPKERSDRRSTDPRGPVRMDPAGPIAAEVIRMIGGRNLTLTRAQAVKRVVRRIRALMGPDAPPSGLLKWWAAEMVDLLDGEQPGMVRVGVLRVMAEAIGLLRPGAGLSSLRGTKRDFIPMVNFKVIEPKKNLERIGTPLLPQVELKDAAKIETPKPEATA